jgi:Na+-driven multidrug efflux pump
VLLAGLATGLAVAIVLGHHVGAGRLSAADRLVRRALAIGLPLTMALALAAALAGPWWLRLFTAYAAMVALCLTFLVLALGSWWLGLRLGLGLVGLWIACAADEWVGGLAMWWRWRRRGWLPHARASHRRLRRLSAAQGG